MTGEGSDRDPEALRRGCGERLLTDVTGPFYTLILELTLPDLAAVETTMSKVMGDKEFHANHEKFVPLVEAGHRDVFNLVQ